MNLIVRLYDIQGARRALLKDAPIFFLDEATSSLDSVTERQIQKSIEQLMQGHTTIVIAHRLSTIAHLDRIVVFHGGKVIEDGTHKRCRFLRT